MDASADERSGSLRRRAAFAALLLAVGLARFSSALFFSQPLGDELVYDAAFARVEAGGSAYDEPGFLYPPPFARLGASLRAFGALTPLYVLRALNLLALVALIVIAMRWLPWGAAGNLAAGIAVMLLSPAVAQGITLGNVSFVVAALIVLALVGWPKRALLSGALLGSSLVLKPLAPAAWVALAFQRPRDGGRRHLWACAAAVAVAAVAVVAAPGWSVFAERAKQPEVLASTVSPHRFLALAGAGRFSPLLTLALLALVAALVRRRPLSPDAVLAVAVAGCVLASPLVWNHTLLLTLPLQAMAIGVAVGRRRAERSRRAAWELALVALAVVTLHLAEGATGITDRSAALQAAAVLPPVAAPIFLLGYVLRRRDYAA